jgi:uncharacterized membrane protein YhaH (DUF805 family)
MAITQCSECGGKVSTSATACPHCGFPVGPQITCPDCGEELAASLVACPVCGVPIAVPETPEKPSEPPAPVAAPLPVAASDSTRLERSAPVIESVGIPKPDFRTLYFSLKGRISRETYWLRFFFPIPALLFVGFFLLEPIDRSLGYATPEWVGPVRFTVLLAMVVPIICACVKRLHDRNMTGWHVAFFSALALPGIRELLEIQAGSFLVSFVVGLYGIYLFTTTGFLRGTEGPNRHGPDPLRGSAK